MALSKLAAESSFRNKVVESGLQYNPPLDPEADDIDVRDSLVEAYLNRNSGRSYDVARRRRPKLRCGRVGTLHCSS